MSRPSPRAPGTAPPWTGWAACARPGAYPPARPGSRRPTAAARPGPAAPRPPRPGVPGGPGRRTAPGRAAGRGGPPGTRSPTVIDAEPPPGGVARCVSTTSVPPGRSTRQASRDRRAEVGDVLEHLAGDHDVGAPVGERQRLGVAAHRRDAVRPGQRDGGRRQVDADVPVPEPRARAGPAARRRTRRRPGRCPGVRPAARAGRGPPRSSAASRTGRGCPTRRRPGRRTGAGSLRGRTVHTCVLGSRSSCARPAGPARAATVSCDHRRRARAGLPPRAGAGRHGDRRRARRRASAPVLRVAAAFAAGQLATGWSNDWIDRDRDVRTGRTDKPVVQGRLPPRTLRRAATAAGAACVPLSLALGRRGRDGPPRGGRRRRSPTTPGSRRRPAVRGCRTPSPSGCCRASWRWPRREAGRPRVGHRRRRAARRRGAPGQRPARPRGRPRHRRARAAAPAGPARVHRPSWPGCCSARRCCSRSGRATPDPLDDVALAAGRRAHRDGRRRSPGARLAGAVPGRGGRRGASTSCCSWPAVQTWSAAETLAR